MVIVIVADAEEAAASLEAGGFDLVVVADAAAVEMLPSVALLPGMALFVWVESDMVLLCSSSFRFVYYIRL